MRLAEYFDPYPNVYRAMPRQVGIDAAISKLDRRSDGEWNNSDDRSWDDGPLQAMRRRSEEAGLELVGIEDYLPMDCTRQARHSDALLELNGLPQLGAHRHRPAGPRRCEGGGAR